MDIELVRTIAALVSLSLGFLVFGLLVCQVYLNAPKLITTVSRASIRAVEANTFDLQIDLDISATRGDICLKELAISHSIGVFDPDKDVKKRSMSRLVKQLGYCVLDGEKQDFPERLRTLLCQSMDAVGMRLTNGERRLFSIVDRISIEQPSDGSWSWPTEGWTLSIRTSAGRFRIPLTFSVHEANEVNAFCRDYNPSGAMVWSC